MTQSEFGNFSAALKSYYPREKLLPTKEAVTLWYRQLEDIPYALATMALNQWVAVNKWSPSIADIRETAAAIKYGEPKDWGDGWEQVKRAISNFGMYREEEALNSITDPTARETVRRIGFITLCTSENPTAERANFRMIYERLIEREKQDRQIPEALKGLINKAAAGMIEGG